MGHNRICIYHGNCADGFGAAYAVWKKYGTECDFHPGVYQEPPPYVSAKDVIIVDFSYKRDVMMEIGNDSRSLLVLDHHKSAAEDLKDLPYGEIHFDMERSGAMMAWNHFHPDTEPPQFIKHIQDRDLWRFALPGTREIQAAIFSYPYDFGVWDAFDCDSLRLEGTGIERKHFKDIAELLGVTQRRMMIAGFNVPVANLPYTLVSDAANKMAQDAPFAACYWDTPAGRQFGLRSIEGRQDVSEIAKQYGGGGHARAAGFRVPWGHVLTAEAP